MLVDPASEQRVVAFGEPAYPVYERGALFAGADVRTLPLLRENGFLPDLEALDERTALVWVNYPHNPTGALAPLSFYEDAARLHRPEARMLDAARSAVSAGRPRYSRASPRPATYSSPFTPTGTGARSRSST